jgi:hypothetical protein
MNDVNVSKILRMEKKTHHRILPATIHKCVVKIKVDVIITKRATNVAYAQKSSQFRRGNPAL